MTDTGDMDDDAPEFTDEPTVVCRHFSLCHTIWFDRTKLNGFSLGQIISVLEPQGGSFPANFPRLFAFGQLYGTPGEYSVVIRLVRIERTEYDEEVEAPVDRNGRPMEWRPTRPLVISGDEFVDPFAFTLTEVRFSTPGIYEFLLCLEEADEPIARERILVREEP